MKKILSIGLLLILGIAALGGKWYYDRKNYKPLPFWQASNSESTLKVDHDGWQRVLDEYLISDDPSGVNLIDYSLLKDELDELNNYLDYMQGLDPRELNRSEQFAYWVNLYNSLTLKVIVDNYPTKSILKVSESGLPGGPWNDKVAKIQNQEITLNDIEHRILRPYWNDYRIHFAVNCASIGCPNVQATAFTVENTEELLKLAAYEHMNHPRGVQKKNGELIVSSLFKWYANDFGESHTALAQTLGKYIRDPELKAAFISASSYKYEYDWTLNDYQ